MKNCPALPKILFQHSPALNEEKDAFIGESAGDAGVVSTSSEDSELPTSSAKWTRRGGVKYDDEETGSVN